MFVQLSFGLIGCVRLAGWMSVIDLSVKKLFRRSYQKKETERDMLQVQPSDLAKMRTGQVKLVEVLGVGVQYHLTKTKDICCKTISRSLRQSPSIFDADLLVLLCGFLEKDNNCLHAVWDAISLHVPQCVQDQGAIELLQCKTFPALLFTEILRKAQLEREKAKDLEIQNRGKAMKEMFVMASSGVFLSDPCGLCRESLCQCIKKRFQGSRVWKPFLPLDY